MSYTIKDVYTEYLSGTGGVAKLPTAVEFVAGAAGGGLLETRYVIATKQEAKEIFKSGPLLQAIEERIDAGSTIIYAWRIAGSAKAYSTLTIPGATGSAFVATANQYGAWWDDVEISVTADGGNRTMEILDPETDQTYSFTAASNAALLAAVNAGQALITLTDGGGGLVAALAATPLAGGNDGLTLANGDYTAAITASEDFTDVNWVHFVGADTITLWTAILTSCNDMVVNNKGERFAFLEVAACTAVDRFNPTSAEMATYLGAIQTLISTVADRNAMIVAGEAEFVSSDGTSYVNKLCSTASGTAAGLSSPSRSLLGQRPTNVVRLTTEWNVAQQATLTTENVIHMRFEPGLGLIFGSSNNRCPAGDAYNRLEKVRATYNFGKAARIASLRHLGMPNDSAGEGLKLLEADITAVAELQVQSGFIDSYTLELESTPEQRNAGEALVRSSVNNLKAFEYIIEKVYAN
jgi:hypothetical protein